MSPTAADVLRLAVLLVLVLINGYFVAAECAVVTVRWTRMDELVARGKFGARAVKTAVERLDDAIAAAQLGITFASLALGWVGEPALAHMLRPLFVHLRAPWNATLTHAAALVIAYLILTYLHVVLRSEEHTSELQSLTNLVCRLLLEKKKKTIQINE